MADSKDHVQEEKGLDEVEFDGVIKLKSKEGTEFSLNKRLIKMSDYIKGLYEVDNTVERIELKNISGKTIEKIITWLEYHEKEPPRQISKPLKSAIMRENVSSWDAKFVDTDMELVFEVLLAANFLNINALLELCCAKVASMMLGKTPKQIRKAFGIKEDFTAEEEAEIRKEFAEFL